MTTAASVLRWSDLRPRQATAVKRKAQQLGVSPEFYIKELISRDLELDRIAQGSTFDELAKPFRSALGDRPESELDAAVKAARKDFHKRVARRKR